MRSRSKKRQTLYSQERIPLVIRLLEEHPVCQRCWQQRSVDVHEIKSRARGGSITDESNLACLCRPCHDLITRSPKRAQEENWSKNSWSQ
jgi:5-methylcytosine-specific restriction endonuclease McrA